MVASKCMVVALLAWAALAIPALGEPALGEPALGEPALGEPALGEPTHHDDAQDEPTELSVRWLEQQIQDAIDAITSKIPDLHLPLLPTIPINVGDIASITLTFADIRLTGLNVVKASSFATGAAGWLAAPAVLNLNVPRVTLSADFYSAAGNMLNVPFNGEGPMSVTLHDLAITLSWRWTKLNLIGLNACAERSSTAIDLDLRRMEVNFENLNEGTDQGELINTVLSSFGPDIFDYLETFLDTVFYDAIDKAIIEGINTAACKGYQGPVPPKVDTISIKEYLELLAEAMLPEEGKQQFFEILDSV